MFDRAFYTMKTNNNYNQLVDHLVTTMPPSPFDKMYNQQQHSSSTFYSENDEPFDTPAYRNYKALVDKEKEQIDTDNLTESIYKLGYKIDTLLSKIITQLDVLLEKDYPP